MKKIFSDKTFSRLLPSLIAIITFIAFLPSLDNGFVNWDDDRFIVDNLFYRGLGWEQLKWMWTVPFQGHYSPLSWMTLGFDYVLWGMEPFGYHLTSLLFHTLNGVIFYFFVILLFRTALPNRFEKEKKAFYLSAGVAALFFAIHPLRVESAVWITERKDVVSGLFALLTFVTYLKYCELKNKVTDFSDKNHRDFNKYQKWYFLCFILFVMTLLTRGNYAPLFGVFIVLDLYPLKRLKGSPFTWFRAETRHIWLEKIPFLIVAFVTGVFMIISGFESYDFEKNPYLKPLGFRLAQAGFTLAFHIVKTLVPLNLSPIYQDPTVHFPKLFSGEYLLSWILIFVFFTLLLIYRKKCPAALACFAAYVILLFPALGISGTTMLTFDRYSYLPCLSWAVLGGAVFFYVLQAYRNNKIVRRLYLLTLTLFLSYLIILGYSTWKQTHVWRSGVTLWSHAAKVVHNNYSIHHNLGVALYDEGKIVEAMAVFHKVKQYHFPVYKKLGKHLSKRGKFDEAELFYKKTIELLRYDNAEAHYNVGDALFMKMKYAEALNYYEKALEFDRKFKQAYIKLGITLTALGKFEKALEHFQKGKKRFPDYSGIYAKTAMVFVKMGRMEDAADEYNKALSLQPVNAEVHNNLANVLTKQKRFAEAIEHYRRALEINPNFELAFNNLNVLLRIKKEK